MTWWVSLQLIDRLTWRCHTMDRGDTVHLEDYVKDIKAIQTMAPVWACDIFCLWLQFLFNVLVLVNCRKQMFYSWNSKEATFPVYFLTQTSALNPKYSHLQWRNCRFVPVSLRRTRIYVTKTWCSALNVRNSLTLLPANTFSSQKIVSRTR